MSAEDRIRWDAIYRARNGQPYPPPDPLLFEYCPPISEERSYRALELAAGLGQNSMWLAKQGYVVDVMEISRVALARTREEMMRLGLRNLNLLQVDLDDLRLPPNDYDIVCMTRFLKRELFAVMRHTTRPGGRVLFETFHTGYLDKVPGFNRAFLLERGELLTHFTGWEILFEMETDDSAQVVAQKPHNAPAERPPQPLSPQVIIAAPPVTSAPPAPTSEPTPQPDDDAALLTSW